VQPLAPVLETVPGHFFRGGEMVLKAFENKGDSPMFVAGRMILPGATEVVDVLEDAVSDVAVEGADEAPELPAGDGVLLDLLEKKVADVVPELASLSGEQLLRVEALEQQGKVRKGVLAEVLAERLKRAAIPDAAVPAGTNAEQARSEDTETVNRDADPQSELGAP
jgi:hypothetical protein